MTGSWGSPGGEEPDSPSRRRLLRNLGLTVGSASVAGCADRDIELGPDVTEEDALPRPIKVTGSAQTKVDPDRAIMEIDVIDAPGVPVADTGTQEELAQECQFTLESRYELIDTSVWPSWENVTAVRKGGTTTFNRTALQNANAKLDQSQRSLLSDYQGIDITQYASATQRERLATRLDDVRSALEAELSDEDTIDTSRFAMDRVDTNRAVHSLLIETQNLSSLGQMAEAALEAGAGRINRVVFTISQDRRAKEYGETIPDAMEDGRMKAEKIARESNTVLVRRRSVDATDCTDEVGLFRQRHPDSEWNANQNVMGRSIKIPEPATDIDPIDEISSDIIEFDPGPITYSLDVDIQYLAVSEDKVDSYNGGQTNDIS